MLNKACTLSDFKMSEEGLGSFSGYGSTWNTRDHAGEIVVRGAFHNCLDRFKSEGFIALQHEYSNLPVATVKTAREDDRGLFIECDFHSTDEAQNARTYMRERLERGKSVGLSIGYNIRPADMERTRDGVLLKEIDLWEVSIVTKPCNPEALASAVKSDARAVKAEYLGAYAEAEMTLAALYDLCDHLRWRCFSSYLFDGALSPEEREAQFDGALSEFHALSMRCVRAYFAADEDTAAEMAAEVKTLFPPPLPALAAGRLSDQIDQALAAVSMVTDRYAAVSALREAEGRALSPATRERLLAVKSAVLALCEETSAGGTLSLDITLARMKASARRRRLVLTGAIGDK